MEGNNGGNHTKTRAVLNRAPARLRLPNPASVDRRPEYIEMRNSLPPILWVLAR